MWSWNARRNWLKPLGWLLLGLLSIELFLRGTAGHWQRYSPDDYALRVERCATQPRDFIIVGGSPVSEGLDPSLIQGVTWKQHTLANGFAVGLPGGTTTDVYYAVQRSCPTWPKLLVYGIAPSDLNDSRNEPHGPASLMSYSDCVEACRVRPDAASWFIKHYSQNQLADCSAIWKHRHGLRMAAADQFTQLFPKSCPESREEALRQKDYADRLQVSNGYAPAQYFATRHYSDMKLAGWVAPPFEYLAKYKTGSHLKYLEKLVEQARANQCDLVLVEMPLTADLEERHATEVTTFRLVFREFCQSRNLPRLVATRTEVGLSDSDFADLIHLNAGGAERLSKWLKVELQQLGEGQP
jgi:hypothetical protein